MSHWIVIVPCRRDWVASVVANPLWRWGPNSVTRWVLKSAGPRNRMNTQLCVLYHFLDYYIILYFVFILSNQIRSIFFIFIFLILLIIHYELHILWDFFKAQAAGNWYKSWKRGFVSFSICVTSILFSQIQFVKRAFCNIGSPHTCICIS